MITVSVRPVTATVRVSLVRIVTHVTATQGTLQPVIVALVVRTTQSPPPKSPFKISDVIFLFFCSVATGYVDVGGVCVENNCLSGPCGNFGSCTPTATSYTCTCRNGYQGTRCDECLSTWQWNSDRTMCVQNFCHDHNCNPSGGVCINGATR